MQLVEKHVINRSHEFWLECDSLCAAASKVRNQALYLQRQSWFYGHGVILQGQKENYASIDYFMQQTSSYRLIPAFLSQQVLRSLNWEWKSFFKALESYKNNPEKFTSKPKPPKYKDKEGRYKVDWTKTRVYKKQLLAGIIQLSTTQIKIQSKWALSFDCVRIIPACGCYVIEVVYTVSLGGESSQEQFVAAIDLGVNNLATVTTNKPGFQPILVNGRPLKAINQGYNKFKANLTALLKTQTGLDWSKRLENLTRRRNHKIDSYLHRASRQIIDLLVSNEITTLVIGMNPDWKRDCNMGKQNNQGFVQIPHKKLIEQLIYKGALVGIKVIVREESYTSKSSFLDLDVIPNYGSKPSGWKPSGKRVKRGMYISKSGIRINADVNGSYNILRKEFPKAFANGIESAVVVPRLLHIKGHIPLNRSSN